MTVKAFWVTIAGFSVGVGGASLLALDWWTGACLVLVAGAILLSFLVSNIRNTNAVVFSIALVAIAAGIARMNLGTIDHDPVLNSHLEQDVLITGVVIDEPDVRENSVRVPIKVHSVSGKAAAGSILAIAPLQTAVTYGDLVDVRGVLQRPESFETGENRTFDYPKFLAKDGITHVFAFAQVERLEARRGNLLKAGAIWIKQVYVRGLSLALPEPYAGLAGGITVGDKRGLGKELSSVFQTVSLTHIIVLSGYNIMIVVYGLSAMMEYFNVGKWWRFWIGVFVAIFFAIITGLASASVRAATMAIIAMIGAVSGRTHLAARSLGIVALGMLLWNPYILAFDPGFQLSIIATAGLIGISPIIAQFLTRIPETLGLREVFASSISAQTAVVPLLLYQSGVFSLYALPANLLALVAVPYAMFFSLIAALAGILAGEFGVIAAFPAYALLSYIIGVAKFFASLPFAAIGVPAFSVMWLAVIYGLYAIVFMRYARTAVPARSS